MIQQKGFTVSQRIQSESEGRECGQYPPIGQCIITFSRISSCVSLVIIGPKRTSKWEEDCSAHKGSLRDPSRGLPTLSAHIFAGFFFSFFGHDLCHMTPKKVEVQLEAREREVATCWRTLPASDASHCHCFFASCFYNPYVGKIIEQIGSLLMHHILTVS